MIPRINRHIHSQHDNRPQRRSSSANPARRCSLATFAVFVGPAIVFLLTGCAQPSAATFSRATHTLRAGLAHAGDHVTSEMSDLADATTDPAERAVIRAQSTELNRQWQIRTDLLLGSMVRYADAIHAVIARRRNEREAARLIAHALQPLLAVHHPAASPLASIGVITHETLADIALARSLEVSIRAADPVIARAASVLADDLDDLAMIHRVHAAIIGTDSNAQALIEAARNAVQVWRAAHRDLLASVSGGGPIDHTRLREQLDEIQHAIDSIATNTGATR